MGNVRRGGIRLSVKISEINENRTHGKTLSGVKAPNLCLDLCFNFRSYAPLSLNLCKIGGSRGLYKQVYLTSAASGIPHISAWCSRFGSAEGL